MTNIDRFRFRYWNKKYLQMLPVEWLGCNNFKDGLITIHEEYRDWAVYWINPELIMQCTGIKDKHGVLIYEGDFLGIAVEGNNLTLEVDKHIAMLTPDICRKFEIIGHKFDGKSYE